MIKAAPVETSVLQFLNAFNLNMYSGYIGESQMRVSLSLNLMIGFVRQFTRRSFLGKKVEMQRKGFLSQRAIEVSISLGRKLATNRLLPSEADNDYTK